MKLRAFLTMALVPLFAGLIGCGTEQVDADVLFLSTGKAASPTPRTYLDVVFAPDDTTPVAHDAEYHVRIDGQWVLISPEDPTYVPVLPRTQMERTADGVAPGAHTYQLVDPSGKVVLTTAPLALTPGRGNQIVVYGGADQLQYQFLTYSQADLDAVPADQVLARVMNLRADRQSIDVYSCPAASTFAVADCTIAKSGLAYGELWQQSFSRDRKLLALDLQWNIDLVCMPEMLNDQVIPEIVTYVPTFVSTVSSGYFLLTDVNGSPTCNSGS